ncbi:MAG: GspE/PulE family protein [Candidatus Aquicultorales bacterium]
MAVRRKRIGEILIQAGVIDEEQLVQALAGQNGSFLGSTLIKMGYASERDIAVALASQLNLEFIDVASFQVDPSAAAQITEETARRHLLLPIAFEDGKLTVAMSDPTNVLAIDDLRIMTGFDIKPVVVVESELKTAIARHCTSDLMEEAIESVDDDYDVETSEEKETEEAPVVKLVNLVLTQAVRDRAGDIHIEPQEKDIRIRFRIDGVLHEIMRSPKKIHAGLASRIKILAGMDIAQRRIPQDGRFGLTIDGQAIDFRVSTIPTVFGEKLVLRLLQRDSVMISLDDLGLSMETLDTFKNSLSKPYGAILVTGPTGSGKTTTLYAALNILNATERNVITVEDPVEYRLAGLNQVQVNTRTGLTFAAALRSILRHDPDIVMIGEIRDAETALIAVESALTGHLVLSTLHTNDAPSSITRLTEMGVEPFLISSAVDCIVGQRLARRLCVHCREPYAPPIEELAKLRFPTDDLPDAFYRPKGCKLCGETGYKGRVGLYEVLVMNDEIERLTVEKASSEEVYRAAIQSGLKPLRYDGFEKVKQGTTSLDELLRVTI